MNALFRLRTLVSVVLLAAPWAVANAAESEPRPAMPAGTGAIGAGGNEVAAASAQESTNAPNPRLVSMPEVVVTATRTKEDTRNLAQSMTVVTPEAIERRQARTPNLTLREEPGIWSVQVASQGSPMIRGQIGNRLLYLWDGIRINNGALFGGPNGYFNQFPVGAVQRMEVIRGSGSVQYGSDAIGGVINIISKRVDYFPSTLEYGAEGYARYGTVDGEVTATGDFWLAENRFSLMGGVSAQDVGDYRGPGVGVIRNTGYEAFGGYVKMAFQPLTNHTLRLSWIQNERDNVDAYVQSTLNPGGVPRLFNPYELRSVAKLEYQLDHLGCLSSELKAYGYYQYYEQMRERRVETSSAMTNTKTKSDQGVFGGGIQNLTPLPRSWGEPQLVYGLDYRAEDLKSALEQYRTPKPSGPTSASVPAGKTPDGTYDVFDLFAMLELHPLERWTVSLGGRFEGTHLNSEPVPLDVIPNAGYTVQNLKLDKTWNSATWSVGTVYGLTRDLDLAGNISTGFRAPTFSDTLSAGPPVFSSKIASRPSPNVNPERSINYEIGPRFHNAHWNTFLTFYWIDLSDVIRSLDSGTVVIPGQGTFIARRSNNAGGGYVRGLEFGAAFKPHRDWTLFGNLTYTEGYDTKFNEYYRFIPPLNGLVGVRYEAPSGRWWAEVVEVLVDTLRHHAPNDEMDAGFSTDPGYGSPNTDPAKGPLNPPLRSNFEIPGYAVTNLRGGVRVWQGRNNRSFDLTLDINNLFNVSYREAYSQQQLVAQGVNVVVGGRLKF